MADQHKYPTIGLRFRTETREWLEMFAAECDRPARAIIAEAVERYRAAVEAGEAAGPASLAELRRRRRVASAWNKVAKAAREAVETERANG